MLFTASTVQFPETDSFNTIKCVRSFGMDYILGLFVSKEIFHKYSYSVGRYFKEISRWNSGQREPINNKKEWKCIYTILLNDNQNKAVEKLTNFENMKQVCLTPSLNTWVGPVQHKCQINNAHVLTHFTRTDKLHNLWIPTMI